MDKQVARRRPAATVPPRAYRQALRARQADANADRILEAAAGLIKTVRRLDAITLDQIATASGVTVRTILRRYGSRDGVLDASFDRLKAEISSLRVATAPGDVDAALRMLINQYEQIGDFNIRALEVEDQLALVHRGLELGRASHRAWLTDVFAPHLKPLTPRARARRLTALYAATDIYVWKLLRRDLHHDRDETLDAVRRLVHGVLTQP